jgi:tocopherol O-methyltransferase
LAESPGNEEVIDEPVETKDIEGHYDRLSRLYRTFWGHHIHHGYFDEAESPAVAQTRMIEQLASFGRIRRDARVLDVGCGIGGSSVWLAENLGCSVLGLTISSVQVDMCRELAQRAGVGKRVSFLAHDANHLDRIDDTFDVVWAIESTEHLQDKRAFIQSAARRLEPGGTLALCAWLVPDSFASPEHRQMARGVCRAMLCPSLLSMREYEAWMGEAGFRETRSHDITRQVESTWEHCARIAARPEVQILVRVMDRQTQQFVAAFDLMRRAYREGAMGYGMLAATL